MPNTKKISFAYITQKPKAIFKLNFFRDEIEFSCCNNTFYISERVDLIMIQIYSISIVCYDIFVLRIRKAITLHWAS